MIQSERQVFGFLILVAALVIAGMIAAWMIEANDMIVNASVMTSWDIPVNDYEKDVIMDIISKFNPRISREEQRLICHEIIERGKQFELNPFLIAGVIAAESSFRPKVVSRCKARGLMQITDTVSRMMGVVNPYDIRQNIYAGSKYLHMLYRRFTDEELVLAAYNAGPTRVARLKRVPKIRETLHYVKKVMDYQSRLRGQLIRQIQMDFVNLAISRVVWNTESAPQYIELKQGADSLRLASGQDWCESRRRSILI